MREQYNIFGVESQEGIAKYTFRKALANKIADIYDESVFYQYGAKIRGCGDSMIVRRYEGGETEIAHTLFCRCRLCPLCAWRRSLKAFGQLSDVMSYLDLQRQLKVGKPYSYILIGLTIRNCEPSDLHDIIGHLFESFSRLIHTQEWRTAIKGCHRTLEVTYNSAENTFHPHLHIIAAVEPSYFTSRAYISQKRLTELWQAALKVAYVPVVDVRKVRISPERKDISEVTKYVTKATDWAGQPLDDNMRVDILEALHAALHGRKLFARYGIIRKAAADLKQTDEDGDLINVQEVAKGMREDLRFTLECYTYIPAAGYIQVNPWDLPQHEKAAWLALAQDDNLIV